MNAHRPLPLPSIHRTIGDRTEEEEEEEEEKWTEERRGEEKRERWKEGGISMIPINDAF